MPAVAPYGSEWYRGSCRHPEQGETLTRPDPPAPSAPQPEDDRRWHDWRWQLRAAIRDPADAQRLQPGPGADERVLARVATRYPVRIPPYYAALIDPADPADPLARMVLPSPHELRPTPGLLEDPLQEQRHMPVARLVHRYRDRALLLVTLQCAAYCRHCTRKRLVGQEGAISGAELRAVLAYLRAHPEIRDVLVSGGDPLLLPDDALERVLAALRSVESVRVLRVGTRVPAVLPMRVTPGLAALLGGFAPLYVSTHFNHPRELTGEAREACTRLRLAGVPLANQCVLLAGVNDDPHTVEALCRGLLEAGVRPYYLLQSDLTQGVEHLRTPLARGLEIMEWLRGRLSGLAIPTFVVDGPYGSGKIPLLPTYALAWAPGRTVLRNFEGQMVVYPDPGPRPDSGAAREVTGSAGGSAATGPAATNEGVAGLLLTGGPPLCPAGLERATRHDGHDPPQVAPWGALMGGLRVALVGSPGDRDTSAEDRAALAAFERVLTSLGHAARRAELGPELPRTLAKLRPDLVLRLPGLTPAQALYVGALFEQLGLRVLGPPCAELALHQRQDLWARLLVGAGVGIVGEAPEAATETSGPARRRVLVAVAGPSGDLSTLRPASLPLHRPARSDGAAAAAAGVPELPTEIVRACEESALRSATALGLRDICLVTLELPSQGAPQVAAVDPLPDLVSGRAPALRLARALGLGHAELLRLALEKLRG